MPIQEAVAMVIITCVLLFGTLGFTSLVLKHRRTMAEIKYGGERRQQSDTNEGHLIEKVDHMADRLAVLEQIAIDPAAKTAREIEDLR